MADLEIFKNDEFGEVRTTIIEGKPYFCGSDVAKALGYSRPNEAVSQHCGEDGTVLCRTLTNGGEQETRFITEGNVHRLIVGASKQSKNKYIQEKAKKYASWIFDEVVPSVREKGYYSINEQINEVPNIPIGDLASFLRIERTVMKDNGKTPQEIAEAFKLVTDQFCVSVPENFIDNKYSQIQFF